MHSPTLAKGFIALTSSFSATLNKLFSEYASPPCLNSSSAPFKHPVYRHSPWSNLDLEAWWKYGHCKLFSHWFNTQLESILRCLAMGRAWTVVTLPFISTQLSTALTVRGTTSLQGSCSPWTLRTSVSTSVASGPLGREESMYMQLSTLHKSGPCESETHWIQS